MTGDLQHIHDPAKAEAFARELGLQIGGGGHPFVGPWGTKGLYAYRSGKYNGMAFFGTGGDERSRLIISHESDKYRPWNRYDSDIPADIRKKLIELEDDDSTSIGKSPQPVTVQPSVETSSIEISGGKIALRSLHTKYLSAQPDGRAEWNRDIASEWEYFHLDKRQGGKITLKGAHGMYVSAQPDGSVQINRQAAPPTGWEEFTVEDRGNNVICLKSVHGKYLSAQPDGTAQWNRDHAPPGGWEEFQIVHLGGIGQGGPATNTTSMPTSVTVSGAGSSEVNGTYVFKSGKHENRHWSTIAGHYQHTQYPEIFIAFQDCGTAHQRPEWNKWMIVSKIGVLYAAHTGGKIGVPPREGGWETVDSWGNPGAPGGKHPAPTVKHDDQASKAATKIQEHSPASRQESIEILEAVAGKPVRFKINNRPSSNDAWVGIYSPHASDQDHGAQNRRWKWLRDIDVNNASLPKQSEGPWSIRVFSDGGYTLHERKDFNVEAVKAEPLDPAAVKSTRKKAWIALVIGLLLLAPGIPLFILGLGGGFQYEAVSSGTFEIEDADGQGDWGFEIFIQGVPGDFNGNGLHDYCENVIISANHTGGWFTNPGEAHKTENPPDESRQVFYLEIAHEGSEGCGSNHYPEQASHDGVQLVKIGRACNGCKSGTTTITAQNVEGDLMWIKTEENQETLGMLIPGAIMMGIGAFTVIVSLVILAKTRRPHGRSRATSADSSHLSGTSYNAGNWFAELSKQSKAIEEQIASGEKLSNHERVAEEMKFPDKAKVEFDIKQGSSLWKWCSHLFNDTAKSAVIARELGLQVGGAGYDFEGKWKDKGLFAYHTGKYAGCAYFGIGGTSEEELQQKGGKDKYRLWEVNDPNMPNSAREKWRKIEPILARSYYLYPPK